MKERRTTMKLILVSMFVLLMVVSLSAQEVIRAEKIMISTNSDANNSGKVKVRQIETIVDTVKSEDGSKRIIINMTEEDEDDNSSAPKAFMGVFTENLTLKKARELKYNYNYGVLITGVTSNTPADKQGLSKNDILMKFNDTELTDKETFENVIARYKAGDKIKLTYHRDGKEEVIDFEFGKRSTNININIGDPEIDFDEDEGINIAKIKENKTSVGYGGGTWMPIWVALDMEDVNDLLGRVGFSELNEDGLLFNGGGGKITIGKGLFLGGMGAGYSIAKKKNAVVNDENVIRRYSYATSFGGVTLDKRFAITKNFIGSIGLMIGGAGQTLEISQTKGDYDWDDFHNQITDSVNNYAQFKKSYIIAQPKVEFLYRLNSWLGFRAEGGYIASYSWNNGWDSNLTGDTFEVSNSPDTKFDTYTISVGPWFGF